MSAIDSQSIAGTVSFLPEHGEIGRAIGFGPAAADAVKTFFHNFLSVRHRTMHGFYQPSDDEARRCLQSARDIIGVLEAARVAMRGGANGV